jgi:cellulose synthase/poly-beta-1,6-N-acetylglucosamine synthase-like glycosyltransferase
MFLTVLLLAAVLHFAIMATLSAAWRLPRSHASVNADRDPLPAPQMSLIIAAHNEAENLQRFLPTALTQDFQGDYEVIVALDRCNDASAQVVAALQERHAHLRVIHIHALPEGWTGKKQALHLAIQAAQHDCLALTDADCALPPQWLQGMADQFAAGKDLVLGVSPYAAAPGLLNLLIRFETLITAILYIGLARLRLPYMAVGRSIGYRKAWFEAVGGFTEIAHRLSGDDDLLVNRATRATNIGCLAQLETQVISLPKTTWRGWIGQKIRHGSAGTAYKPSSLLILSLIHGLHLIFYLSLIVVLCLQSAVLWALAIYLVRICLMVSLIGFIPNRGKTSLMLAFPLLDLMYMVYLMLLLPAAACIQPKWKNNHGGSV